MKDLPKYAIVMIVLFVAFGLLGGGAWWYTAGMVTSELELLQSTKRKIDQVERKKGIPFPNDKNKKLIEESEVELKGLWEKVQPEVKKTSALYDSIRVKSGEGESLEIQGLSPQDWNALQIEKINKLDELAEKLSPPISKGGDFYYGLNSYQGTLPPTDYTLELGVQLMVIEELSRILFEAPVVEIASMKRVMVEDAAGNIKTAPERLKARVISHPEDLYKVYPFEVEFTCSPEALRKVINGISRSPQLLLIRFVDVNNEIGQGPDDMPTRSKVTASAAGQGAAAKLFFPVVGQEKVRVRMRVDAVEWNLNPQPAGKKGKGKKGSKNNRR